MVKFGLDSKRFTEDKYLYNKWGYYNRMISSYTPQVLANPYYVTFKEYCNTIGKYFNIKIQVVPSG